MHSTSHPLGSFVRALASAKQVSFDAGTIKRLRLSLGGKIYFGSVSCCFNDFNILTSQSRFVVFVFIYTCY